jgi:REP element-mobilizing transposase RayT
MARPLRIQYPGAYYHVTCRGNDRKNIFFDQRDHIMFLKKLSISLDIYNVELLAFVLMQNHFHFLVTTPEGNLSEFMRHFNISYTSAFNRKHHRVGHLYQGRYKSFLIDVDNYLLEVSRYIHLNPVRSEKFKKKSITEKWNLLSKRNPSSLSGYFSAVKRKDFVNYHTVLEYMGGDNKEGREAYKKFIGSGLKQNLKNPLELGKGSGIIGEADFVNWIKKMFIKNKESSREQPALRELQKMFDPKELIIHVCDLMEMNEDEICRKGRNSIERAMLMEMLYRFCNITQPEIGNLVGGIDYSAVSLARQRLQVRLTQEPKLRKKFNQLQNQLLELVRENI